MIEQAALKNINDFDNKSLLIVDDDNPFRERLARAMEKKGFEVFQAESVQKGIESVKAKKPGFAVVDLRLGDGNGLEVVKQIQNTFSESSRIKKMNFNYKNMVFQDEEIEIKSSTLKQWEDDEKIFLEISSSIYVNNRVIIQDAKTIVELLENE